MNASKPTSHIIPGIPKLPPRSVALVMPLILSVIMSCIVSAISTFKSLGGGPHYLGAWLGAWGVSWIIAFPVLLLILPIVRRLTGLLVRAA